MTGGPLGALLRALEPVAQARHFSGSQSIQETAVVSIAVSMRRIADALEAIGTPTKVTINNTGMRELSPSEIVDIMRRAGEEPPDVVTNSMTRLDGDDQS